MIFFAAPAGIAAGSNGPRGVVTFVILAFTAAVVIGWAWVSVVAALVRSNLSEGTPEALAV